MHQTIHIACHRDEDVDLTAVFAVRGAPQPGQLRFKKVEDILKTKI